jgi:hypothetical protein
MLPNVGMGVSSTDFARKSMQAGRQRAFANLDANMEIDLSLDTVPEVEQALSVKMDLVGQVKAFQIPAGRCDFQFSAASTCVIYLDSYCDRPHPKNSRPFCEIFRAKTKREDLHPRLQLLEGLGGQGNRQEALSS